MSSHQNKHLQQELLNLCTGNTECVSFALSREAITLTVQPVSLYISPSSCCCRLFIVPQVLLSVRKNLYHLIGCLMIFMKDMTCIQTGQESKHLLDQDTSLSSPTRPTTPASLIPSSSLHPVCTTLYTLQTGAMGQF